jgi:hypothetical protein
MRTAIVLLIGVALGVGATYAYGAFKVSQAGK